MDASQIIDALGGKAAVAEATGRDRNTVLYWERRGRIPSPYWPTLAARAQAMQGCKVTLEVLANHQHPARPDGRMAPVMADAS